MVVTEVVNLIVRINRQAVRGVADFGSAVGGANEMLVAASRVSRKNLSIGTKLGVAVRALTTGFRGFRMEMLSVMFFGMALSGMMIGMMTPAMQLAGIFQIWGMILTILFLPAALKILPKLLELLKIVQGLSPETKKMIGNIVMVVAVLGLLLFFIGQITLGISGLIQFFIATGSAIGLLLSIGFWPLIAIFAVIIALVAAFWFAWKENFGNIRDWVAFVWHGLEDVFEGIKKAISGVIDIIKGMFSGDTNLIAEGFEKMVGGALQVLKGLGEAILGIFAIGGLVVIKILRAALDLGIGIGKAIWQGIKSLGSMIWNFIKSLVPKRIRAFFGWDKEMEEAPATALGGIVTRPQTRLVGEAGPEAIIPLDKMGMMGGINISIIVNAAINSSVDLNNLARRIGAETASSLERNFRR